MIKSARRGQSEKRHNTRRKKSNKHKANEQIVTTATPMMETHGDWKIVEIKISGSWGDVDVRQIVYEGETPSRKTFLNLDTLSRSRTC